MSQQTCIRSTEVDQSLAIKIFKSMLLNRFVDEKMQKLIRQNKGANFLLSAAGHEMIGSVCAHLLTKKKDWALPYYRDRSFVLAFGCSAKELIAACLARDSYNHSGGKMMPEHYCDMQLNIPCQSSVVGSQFLHAVGIAKAMKLSGSDAITYVSGGDGSTSQGDFHEALNFSCIHKLANLFVIQDNEWAISVAKSEQTAGLSIAKQVRGFENLHIEEIDGCNFMQVYEACINSIKHCKEGTGPALIVAKVPRIGAHSSSDDPKKYMSFENLEKLKDQDPIPKMESFLLSKGLSSPDQILDLKEEVFAFVENQSIEAEKLNFPEVKDLEKAVFAPYSCEESLHEGEEIVMVDAINHGIDEEMEKDESVIVFGQDVAHGKGGVFGATRNLTQKYGNRCFNTPLAESTIVGISIGLALSKKFKPIAEVQFADYLWTGFNQLINELSSMYFRSNSQCNCPVVIRMPCGGYIQGGPYHSQNIEAFLAHIPGLKIAIPSNASDAKRLLKAAVRDPNPVIFLEHKALYRQKMFCARKEPSKEDLLPFGTAAILQEGADITVVSYGMMSALAFEVVQNLQKQGIQSELIDLRTIVPLDMDTIKASVKKTGKLLIVYEAAKFCGFGAEIAAQISEELFEYLDAPIQRIAAKHAPVAYAKNLELRALPSKEDIEKAIKDLASF